MNPLWYILAAICIMIAISVTAELFIKWKARREYEKQRQSDSPILFKGIQLPTMKNKRGFNIVDSNKLLEDDPALWCEWRHSKGVSDKEIIQDLNTLLYTTFDPTSRAKLSQVLNAFKRYSDIKYVLQLYKRTFKEATLQLANAMNQEDADKLSKERDIIQDDYKRLLTNLNAPSVLYSSSFQAKLINANDIEWLLLKHGITFESLINK